VLELVDARLVLEPAIAAAAARVRAPEAMSRLEAVEALLHVRVREQIEIRHRYDDRERDHAEHVQILAAIRAGDPKAAETLTRTHLESIRKAIETAKFRPS
jgi:GntR family transcriptional repressor for pyruvate dehydrogenase complex